MKYESTRGKAEKVESAHAIKAGIAPDGGLYVPDRIPHIDYFKYLDLDYRKRALDIFRKFLTDFSDPELIDCIETAYSPEKFDVSGIVSTVRLNENMSILELWHGPTYAFKDIALQILPCFLAKAVEKTGENKKILILVATSGDTGKAALEGFCNVEGTDIIVFFPKDGVSRMQALAMLTQEGENVSVIEVEGNFDDAQNGIKEIFSNEGLCRYALENEFMFSSANSINWGRLLPQIVYYFSAYLDMVKQDTIEDGEKINVCIPTGNFGNILAAYYAKIMGLPVNKLICASNENNILTDFMITGVYDTKREFIKTISPSMDILISSNLERLLFELTGRDEERVSRWMKELGETGRYQIDNKTHKKISSVFFAGFCNEEETLGTVEDIFNKFGYLIDPHTAVAIDVYDKYIVSTQDMSKTLIASTASPFKFEKSVSRAILGEDRVEGRSERELQRELSEETNQEIPAGLLELHEKKILHHRSCRRQDMGKIVREYIDKRSGK